MESSLQIARGKLDLCIGEDNDKNKLLSVIHDILKCSVSLNERYYYITCSKLLLDNCHKNSVDEISALIEALKILEKYGKNLLRNDRPEFWRIVRLSNTYFHEKVDIILGSRCILQQMGYTAEVHDGLAFPPSVLSPDKKVVTLVTSDIVLLKYELFWLQTKQHPCPSTITQFLHNKKPTRHASSPGSISEALDVTKPGTSAYIGPEYHCAEITDCVVCGQKLSELYCPLCDKQLCISCDEKWHLSRERVSHKRKPLQSTNSETSYNKPFDNNLPSLLDQPISEIVREPIFGSSLPSTGHEALLSQSARVEIPNDYPSYSKTQHDALSPTSKFGFDSSLNWEERFEFVKNQLHATTGLDSQQKIVDAFCIEVDDQVKKYMDEANGLGDRVQQHFQGRGQYLLEKKFEFLKYFSDLQKESNLQFLRQPSPVVFDEPNPASITGEVSSLGIRYPPLPSKRQKDCSPSNFTPTVVAIQKTQVAVSSNFVETKLINEECRPVATNKLPIPNHMISLKKENYRLECLKTIDKLRVAEEQNHTPTEMQIALQHLEKDHDSTTTLPIWLSQNLHQLIQPLVDEYPCITFPEACKVFNDNDGDIELTRKAIRIQHSLKLSVLCSSDFCNKQEAVACLNRNNGNCCKALIELQKPLVQNFLTSLPTSSKDKFLVKDFVSVKDYAHLKDALIALLAIKETLIVDMMSTILMECFQTDDSRSELYKALKRYDIMDVYEAAKSFPGSIELALKYLGNQCSVCLELFPQNKLECMTACGDNGCTYCQECLATFLQLKIREGHICELVCPVCKLPDIDEDEEAATTHFSYLDVVIKKYLDEQIHAVYQKKLTDRVLMKTPNFRWCSHCENGFVYERNENSLKMVCSACHKATCYNCKKKWEDQHEGLTCQAFLAWKQMNDTDFQAKGLAAHLRENGIDCPTCKYRYDLAKGGCMHFKCLMCFYQFCSGCKSPFKQGQYCTVQENCFNRGLHAHHPRDCLFYLRDLDIVRLQRILSDAEIEFGTESQHHHHHCRVPEQKEKTAGLVDEVCGRLVLENNADLCELHYKEYLVNLINGNHLDPAEVFSVDELETCLNRSNKPLPNKTTQHTDDDYRIALLELVKKMPLIHQKRVNGEKIETVTNATSQGTRTLIA